MWMMDILYAISIIFVFKSPYSSVDTYRGIRGRNNSTYGQLLIPVHFAVVALH